MMDQPYWRHRVLMRFSSLKPKGVPRLVAQHLLVLCVACLSLFFFFVVKLSATVTRQADERHFDRHNDQRADFTRNRA
jgi:hypothetical protein